MNRRGFVVGCVLAASPVAARAANFRMIYVGGWDCQPCSAWKNKYKAEWLASPEYKRVTWIEVDAPKLKEAYQDRYWPGDLKPILDQLPRKGGTRQRVRRCAMAEYRGRAQEGDRLNDGTGTSGLIGDLNEQSFARHCSFFASRRPVGCSAERTHSDRAALCQ